MVGTELPRAAGRRRLTEEIPKPSTLLLRRLVLGSILGVLVALTVFAALAHSWLLTWDEPFSDALRSERWAWLWKTVTILGATELAITVSLLVGVLLWNRCRALAVLYPAAVLAGMGVNVLLKFLVDRPRPEDAVTGIALPSFPSGHAIQATLLLGLLPPAIYLLTRRAWVFWVTTGVLGLGIAGVAFSRVALGAHWPSDVVAGVLIGVSLLLVVELLMESRPAARLCRDCPLHSIPHPSGLHDDLGSAHC